jgi:hypothetical protein
MDSFSFCSSELTLMYSATLSVALFETWPLVLGIAALHLNELLRLDLECSG